MATRLWLCVLCDTSWCDLLRDCRTLQRRTRRIATRPVMHRKYFSTYAPRFPERYANFLPARNAFRSLAPLLQHKSVIVASC